MRRLAAALAVALGVCGCSSVEIRGGLPVLAKSPDGLLVAGTAGAPDLDRGNQARVSGRLDDALTDLKPLAELGYADAQVSLAATYFRRDTLADEREAIRWYRKALPERPEAAIPLAGVLVGTGNRDNGREALALIRSTQKTLDPPSVPAALLGIYARFPDLDGGQQAPGLADSAARSPLIDNRVAAIGWARANLASGDNAKRLQKWCENNLDVAPACYVDLAHFLRYQNRLPELKALVGKALEAFAKGTPPPDAADLYHQPIELPPIAAGLAAAMVDQIAVDNPTQVYENFNTERDVASIDNASDDALDVALPAATAVPNPAATAGGIAAPPANAVLDQADRVLRWMLKQTGEYPAQAAGVASQYPFLITDVDLAKLLETAAASGQHQARLALGRLYLFGLRAPIKAKGAEDNLRAATAFRSTTTNASLLLGHLYAGPLLGQPAPQAAVDNTLLSARDGNGRAYADLAEQFFSTAGIRINRVYAYVFARRAEDAGYPVVLRMHVIPRGAVAAAPAATGRGVAGVAVFYRLLDRLKSELSPSELAEGDRLYQDEKSLVPSFPARLPPDIYSRNTP